MSVGLIGVLLTLPLQMGVTVVAASAPLGSDVFALSSGRGVVQVEEPGGQLVRAPQH